MEEGQSTFKAPKQLNSLNRLLKFVGGFNAGHVLGTLLSEMLSQWLSTLI